MYAEEVGDLGIVLFDIQGMNGHTLPNLSAFILSSKAFST